MLNQRNSKKQGDVGLGIAIGWFVSKGFTVCIPLTDSQEYDLVVDMGVGLKKVQVKTTKHLSNNRQSFVVALRTMGGNRSGINKIKYIDPTKLDYLFILTMSGTKYLIPIADIGIVRNELTLSSVWNQYKV